MRKKLVTLLMTSIMAISTLAGCASSGGEEKTAEDKGEASASEGQQEITIWCWDTSDNGKKMNEGFTEATGIKVNMVAVESKDMTQKLQTTLASGGEMPDIAWLEATFRGKLLSLDIWEDITKEPYNFDTNQVLDYLIPLETAESGQYIGPECPSVAGMAYKRELAKEYLGTDDPKELEAMLSDWDSFIEKGKEVKEKSDGKIFMMSSLGAMGQILKGQSTEPFVDGDKLNLDTSMKPILEKLLEAKQAGIIDVLDFSSAEEGASYANDVDIFYPCANWSVEFTIKPNDKDGLDRWGFMLPPGGPFPWGGTVMGVPKQAKNKEAAAEYVKFMFGSEEGAILQRDCKGNFSPYKGVYEKEDFYTKEDEYFAGQDVQKAIAQDVLPNIEGVREPSKYDQDIDDAYNLALKSINADVEGELTAEELIDSMEGELLNKQPQLNK